MNLRNSETEDGYAEKSVTNKDVLSLLKKAVLKRPGLISGKLKKNGAHCALGCFWADHPNTGLDPGIADEIAAVNDAVPKTATPRTRREYVLRWINLRLKTLAKVTP